MSVRYDRQYKMLGGSDIEGPLGPQTNYDQFNNLNNDFYLGGPGGGGVGGGGSVSFQPVVPPAAIIIPNVQPIEDVDYSTNYEIVFSSNLQNELGTLLKLKYDISSDGTQIESETLDLENSNTDNKQILSSLAKKSTINFYLDKTNLPANYKILKIIYANKPTVTNSKNDLSKWSSGSENISIPASELLSGGIAINVIIEKEINVAKPIISLNVTKYEFNVKDSDSDTEVNIAFSTSNAEYVDVYLSATKKIRIDALLGISKLYFKKDFEGIFGNKKIILVPVSDLYGTGDRIEATINFISVNDFPSITQIIFPDVVDIPSFSDFNLEYDVEWNSFAVTSVDVDLVLKNKSKVSLFKSLPPNGKVKINLKELSNKFTDWNGSDNVTLIFKPYNRGGSVQLTGNAYEIKSSLILPTLNLDEDIIKKSLFDAFVKNLKFTEPEKESKYLTHLVNFGNDEQIIVSSWEEDNFTLSDKKTNELGNTIITKEVQSLILKLYNPLPVNINENSTLWITRLLTNPLVETVVLNDQSLLNCPPIKGPNFNIDVDFVKGKSTNYESLDDLVLNTSDNTSSNLISKYLSGSLVNTDDLNIEYVSGSTYNWKNFVHFSSAKERVDNFVYKVQLIEVYENLITSAETASWNSSLSAQQEQQKQTIKKEQIVQSFDGFEKFLYTSSSLYTSQTGNLSSTWPYSGSTRLLSTNSNVSDWYNNIITLAEDYDIENSNWIQNNIPQYIVNNTENDSLLLFFSMIGQHFDNIYFHTKSIEKSRGLGYKSKDGISDKLLFDTLKSFNWDAKNLDVDSQLWKYAFGVDADGNTTQSNPAKQRTYEVWRRIINNLPYLLKHKGTRRGIYALMACYGIPSSNLSILEFGGPEVSTTNKSKFEFDNITTALKMISGSYIQMDWQNTERGRKPDTIEFFIKPNYASEFTLISGSGWDVTLSGSLNDRFGVVNLNISSSTISTTLTSNKVPLFNGKFFGVEVSRTSGSGDDVTMSLNLRQSDKDRTLFQSTSSISFVGSNWEDGSTIRFGGNYIGSLDEFRLWSTPLDKERFFEHVSFPEMINGNSYTSSTDDLYFRLDFEYPKNLAETSSLINVDANIWFSGSLTRNDYENGNTSNLYSENPSPLLSASAYFPNSINTYPHQFEVVDRSVVLEIPDVGSTRYSTNKVRFEEQTLVSDLSVKSRATKKSFDQSPVDSNRVGLFFSPTKELNIDIAKSLGGLNLDNYIGDPSDSYKSNYSNLDNLRNYYFQRFDGRDIYSYINLIKLYEKSMFEDIKNMLPARVKATTGLLIEPHILERSKIKHTKPIGDDYQKETIIHYDDTTILTSTNNQYEVIVDSNLGENLMGENNQFDSTIFTASVQNTFANNYQYDSLIIPNDDITSIADSYQYYVTIDSGLDNPSILTEIDIYDNSKVVGQSEYESIGFGIYAENGHAIRTYFDENNRRVKERIKIDLIKEQKRRDIVKYKVVINGQGDPRGGSELTSSIYYETKLNIQPFSDAKVINAGTGSIVEVTPVSGYLKTHYRNTSDLTRGLENSFFRGSKNTAATTLDGSSPIETFVSNPNVLTVNKTGRNTSEPILEVE